MAVRGDSGALEDALGAVMEHVEGHLEPLAAEMVAALESAARLRAAAQAEPFSTLRSGRVLIHPGFEAADRDARRAIQLAKTLDLKGPRQPAAADPFAALDVGRASSLGYLEDQRRARAKPAGGAA
jgi:hypothetical protein